MILTRKMRILYIYLEFLKYKIELSNNVFYLFLFEIFEILKIQNLK